MHAGHDAATTPALDPMPPLPPFLRRVRKIAGVAIRCRDRRCGAARRAVGAATVNAVDVRGAVAYRRKSKSALVAI
jgi:hypothetical protein